VRQVTPPGARETACGGGSSSDTDCHETPVPATPTRDSLLRSAPLSLEEMVRLIATAGSAAELDSHGDRA
jgi:hypothetical protein